jgi:hypothetical protein
MTPRNRRLVWLLVLCGCGRSADGATAAGSGGGAGSSDTGNGVSEPTRGEGTTGGTHGMSGQSDGTAEPTVGDADAGGSAGDGSTEPVDEMSDEFDDPATLALWMQRDEVEGGPASIESLSIAEGLLQLRPTAGGWYNDYVGAMLYKSMSGNFIIETHVTAVSRSDPASPPTMPFNSGGLIVRDPASGPGAQNWIAHNLGFQSASVATESKTTIDSQSELFLVTGIHHGRLRLCRWDDTFVLARRLDGDPAFEETHRFERPDLGWQLQVGMMANGWNSTGSDPDTSVAPDVDVSFDYVRFWRPSGADDCVR